MAADLTTRLSNFLTVLGTGAVAPSLTGILSVNTTAVIAPIIGGEMMTYTLPANALASNGQALRVRAYGTIAGNIRAKTIQFQWGGTNVMSQVLLVPPLSSNLQPAQWFFDVLIVRTGAAAQTAVTSFHQLLGGVAWIRDEVVARDIIATLAADETASIVVRCVAVVTDEGDVTQTGMIVEGLL